MTAVTQSTNGHRPRVDHLMDLVRDLTERNRQLQEALDSRIVIEQAKGILGERYGLECPAAFELLRLAARSNRIRVHQLAAATVASPDTPREIANLLRS